MVELQNGPIVPPALLRQRQDGLVVDGVDDLPDPPGGGGGLGEHDEHPVEAHDALEDHGEIGEEGQDHAGLGLPRVHTLGAQQHHQHQPHVQAQLHGGSGDGHDDAGLQVIPCQVLVGLVEAALLIVLLGQGFDHPDAGDVLRMTRTTVSSRRWTRS